MLEKEIERYLDWLVQRNGGKTYKFKSPSQRGVADRIVCLPNGETWFIELKRPDGRLSKLQEIFAGDMQQLKQNYACLWTKEQVDEWSIHCKYIACGLCPTTTRLALRPSKN